MTVDNSWLYLTPRQRRRTPGEVTSKAEVALIQARVDYAGLPLWRRITTRAPKGWR